MIKLCAVTGMQLTSCSHFSNYFTRSIHPLLECSTTHLLQLASSKQWMDWQDEEAKLLFLALANSLSLVEVVPPAIATPSPQVIASSIEMLFAIAGWHSIRSFPLPTLRISLAEANSEMLEFPQLLNTIIASREETAASEKIAVEAIRLEEAIKVLFSKCSIGANKHKMLRSRVADWAIKITHEAANKERVTADTLKLWHQMLTTAPIDAWKFQTLVDGKASSVDILELDEFMTCNLPHGCTASYEVMKHLTAMKNATTQLASFLGIDNVITVISEEELEGMKEPKESEFSSKLEFLIAKAKFQQKVASVSVVAPTVSCTIPAATSLGELEGIEDGEDKEAFLNSKEEEEGDSNDYGI